ncbi:MAG: transketolase [Chlamydiota bacterium]
MESAVTPRAMRRLILDESMRAHVGHIGSALSIAEIVAVLFGEALRFPGTDDPQRDRFILSKGHAVLALYAALMLKGILTREELATYCGDGTLLGAHPEHTLRGIDFSTGSLGHGLAIGAGVALAARMAGSPHRAFVLVSDAECNEGSLWETVMFAAHHRLSNLVAVVDDNGQQAMGKTRDIIDLSPLGAKWRAFGWDVREVDGHSVPELRGVLCAAGEGPGRPRAVIARTVSGRGVSFMEGEVKWHYLPLTGELYERALGEIEAAP